MSYLLDETGLATDVQKCELSLGSIINPINILATKQENFAITGELQHLANYSLSLDPM
jgi:hypothetical protein